jgi:hypothetical protein
MMRADLYIADRSMMFNSDLVEALELDNMLAQASVLAGRKAAVLMRARISRSGTIRTGSNIPFPGAMKTAVSGLTIGRCICSHSPTK